MTTSPPILSAVFLGICLFAVGNTDVAAASASPPSEPTAAASTFKTPPFAPSSPTTTVVESMTPSQCATPIPCQPTLCPSGQCYVLTTRTLVTFIPTTSSVSTTLSSTSTTTSSTTSPQPQCSTQIICGCGPDPTIATPITNPTPKPVEPCSEREVEEAGCAQGQVALPTSVGAKCRQCVCVESGDGY